MKHFLAFLLLAVPITTPSQMYYKADGSNSTTRKVSAKLGDVVSCNDKTGATAGAQIANAIADLPATGGTIDCRMLSGAQTISSTVTISKPVVLLLPPSGAATFTVTANPAFLVSNVTGVTIDDGTLSLSGVNSSAVQYDGTVTDFTVQNMTVTGSGVVGDAQQGFWNNSGQTLTNIRFLNNTLSNVMVGMSINADQGGSITGGLIQGNHLSDIVGTGVGQGYAIHHANGSANRSFVRIVGNLIERAQRHGIYQARGRGVVIDSNQIKDHRSGQSGGVQRSAIVVSRSADVTVTANVVENPLGGGLEVDTDSSTPAVTCRNIVFSSNVVAYPKDFYPVTIGTANPATDGICTDITFIGNQIFADSAVDDTYGGSLVQIYSGKRVNFVSNYLSLLNAGGTRTLIQVRGVGETAGTATYTDDLQFKTNYLYGTGGSPTYGWEFYTTAATSAIRADFIANRVNTNTPFLFDATQTDPNLYVLHNLTGGLDVSLLKPIEGTSVPTLLKTAQVANLAATSVYAAAPVGEYRVCATARTTTSGTGTTATLNIVWTDEGGVKTDLVGTWALNSVTVTGQINKCEYIHAAAATNIQVSVTAGTYGTSVYALSATAERLN